MTQAQHTTKRTYHEYYLPKLLYLIYYLNYGCTASYVTLFYQEVLGFSSKEQGVIASLSPFISFIACPFWTAIGDKTGRHKIILLACCITSNAIYILIPILRPNFMLTAILIALNSTFGSTVSSLLDVLVLERLLPTRELYGKQRLWGSVGAGVAGPIIGTLINSTGNLYLMFWLGAGFAMLFCFIVAVSISDGPKYGHVVEEKLESGDDFEEMKLAKQAREPYFMKLNRFFNTSFALFLVSTFLYGIQSAVIATFEFLFLSDYLHATPVVLGAIPMASVLMQLPFFFFAREILNGIGTKKMFILAQLLATVRVLLYIVLYATGTNVWLCVPVDLLHGATFACFWAAAVHHATEVAPEGLEGTSQGLLNGVWGGFGYGIGSFGGGYLYPLGPYVLWTAVAGSTMGSMIAFPILDIVLRKIGGQPQRRRMPRTKSTASTVISVAGFGYNTGVAGALENMDL